MMVLNEDPTSHVTLVHDTTSSQYVVLKQFNISECKLEGVDPWHECDIMRKMYPNAPIINSMSSIDGNNDNNNNTNNTTTTTLSSSPTNIITMIRSEEDQQHVTIVLEYMPCDSLYAAITHEPTPIQLTEDQCASIIFQVVIALEWLHNNNIIHRDVKPSNFLLNMLGEVKLADFGIGHIVQNNDQNNDQSNNKTQNNNIYTHQLTEQVGTVYYLPPEIVLRKGYTAKCDVWSLGISLIQLITNTLPLENETTISSLTEYFQDDGYNPLHYIPFDKFQNLSDNCKDFINQCCQYDPEKRPTMTILKSHPFIAKNKGKKSPMYALCDQMSVITKNSHFPK